MVAISSNTLIRRAEGSVKFRPLNFLKKSSLGIRYSMRRISSTETSNQKTSCFIMGW